MGGKEAIQKLREVDPGVRAIVSSGYSQDPVMANYREYGFSEVIAKPYSSLELSRIMRKVIAGPQNG
jgi:DNA-binding NarL/FixJ family response regulator